LKRHIKFKIKYDSKEKFEAQRYEVKDMRLIGIKKRNLYISVSFFWL